MLQTPSLQDIILRHTAHGLDSQRLKQKLTPRNTKDCTSVPLFADILEQYPKIALDSILVETIQATLAPFLSNEQLKAQSNTRLQQLIELHRLNQHIDEGYKIYHHYFKGILLIYQSIADDYEEHIANMRINLDRLVQKRTQDSPWFQGKIILASLSAVCAIGCFIALCLSGLPLYYLPIHALFSALFLVGGIPFALNVQQLQEEKKEKQRLEALEFALQNCRASVRYANTPNEGKSVEQESTYLADLVESCKNIIQTLSGEGMEFTLDIIDQQWDISENFRKKYGQWKQERQTLEDILVPPSITTNPSPLFAMPHDTETSQHAPFSAAARA